VNVVVDQILIHYEISGIKNSPLVLIIPGWADTTLSWQPFTKGLSKKYQVVVVDLPGFGGSQAPDAASWGLDNYAEFIAHFLKKLDYKPVAIIAHSNGGAIALRGLSKELLTTNKLVLLASAGIRNQYKGRNHALRVLTKTGKVITMPLPASVKKRLRRTVYNAVGSDMLVAEAMQETFKRVVTDDVQADADKVDIPTLLLYGENDTAAPVTYGRIFHEHLSNSTLEIIPGAGHFLHTENTAQTLKLVEEFLI
jgi:pimeloyl-ACP methyl ester carboxylesterase